MLIPSSWKIFERVEIISSVPSSVIINNRLISSTFNGSEKILRSLKGILFSFNQARAFRQDVQLGDVYKITMSARSFFFDEESFSTTGIVYEIDSKRRNHI
jgi:hypothetical protein